MIRKTVLALAATASLAVVALTSTAASAWPHHGHRHHVRGFGVVIGGPVYADCLRYRWVETRRGLRRMLVNVCY